MMIPMYLLCDGSLGCSCPDRRNGHQEEVRKRAQQSEYARNYRREERRKAKENR